MGIQLQDDPNWDAVTRQLLGANRLRGTAQFGLTEVVNGKYLRGKTPLKLALKPGNYAVFVEIAPSAPIQDRERLFDELERDSVHGPSLTGKISGLYGNVYLIEILEGKFNRLIQLWQPIRAPLEEIEKFYPTNETFQVNDAKGKAALEGNVPSNTIPTLLRLLRKGGKAVYRQGNTRTIMQVNPLTGDIDTVLKYQD